jgi:hypothetical protein
VAEGIAAGACICCARPGDCAELYISVVSKMKHSMAIFFAVLMVVSPLGQATTKSVSGNVLRTLVADKERFGGCMVKLDKTLANYGLDCPGGWVSFSCSGTYTPKDIAYRMFDSAQMSFSLGKQVMVEVDDTKKHNGYCYSRRIDVLQ